MQKICLQWFTSKTRKNHDRKQHDFNIVLFSPSLSLCLTRDANIDCMIMVNHAKAMLCHAGGKKCCDEQRRRSRKWKEAEDATQKKVEEKTGRTGQKQQPRQITKQNKGILSRDAHERDTSNLLQMPALSVTCMWFSNRLSLMHDSQEEV